MPSEQLFAELAGAGSGSGSGRVLVADGAMGTMLQAYDLGLDDFEGLEGCNEVLNESAEGGTSRDSQSPCSRYRRACAESRSSMMREVSSIDTD